MRSLPVAIALLAMATACVDDPQEIGPGDVVRLLIHNDSFDLRLGDTLRLRGLALDASGAIRVGAELAWGTDRPDILEINPDSGWAVGLLAGMATVTARHGDLTAEARVRVAPGPRLVLGSDSAGFTAKAGGADPAVDTIAITNTGGFALTGLTVDSIAYADTAVTGWLMAGIDSNAAPTHLRLTPMVTGLTAPGTYLATLRVVAAEDVDDAPQTVRVRLTIAPGEPASMAIQGGDAQMAVVAQMVPTAPSALIADAFGNPVPGVAVAFTVISGGGTAPVPPVEGGFINGSAAALADTVQTDSAGVASVTSWTLGPVVGANMLAATVVGDTAIAAVTFTATGTPAGAAQITATQGGGQSATVGTMVAVQPQVRIQDQFGNDVPGAAVTFSVTSGNGVVAGGGVTTDATGLATVASWTVDTVVGTDTLLAQAAGVSDTVRFMATSTPGAAATLARAGGDGQADTVGATLAVNPSVRATDQYGNAVAGVAVGFAVTAGGGVVGASSATTGADGLVSTRWTLGSVPGTNTMSATSAGLAGSPIAFTATATAGAPSEIAITQGDGQTATVATAVPLDPAVRIEDASGNPVAGVTVTFTPTAGGGQVVGGSVLTNASGVAAVGDWVLGTTAGGNTLLADAGGGLAVTFAASGVADAPDTIFVAGGVGQTATVGTAVTTPPSVRVTDRHGNPVSGQPVTFNATGGSSATGTSATTDATGTATVGSWTLGTTAGGNTLQAVSTGLGGSPVSITATGTADVADSIAIEGGNAQVAVVGTAVAAAPTVRVFDQYGNRVPGVEVVFAVTTGGGMVTGGTVVTDVGGDAEPGSWVLGTMVGANALEATAMGAGIADNPRTFSATGVADVPDTLAVVNGDGQTATAGAAVAVAPSVRVVDQYGNPVAGVAVTFTPSGDGVVNPATPVATNAAGAAALTSWTLASAAGGNTLTASIVASATGNPATFNATGEAGTAGGIAMLTQPSAAATSGAPLGQQPIVQLVDGLGNPTATAGVDITASIASGPGGTVSGTVTVQTAADGQATFTDLVITGLVGNYRLGFNGPSLSGVNSAQIALSAGPADTVFASAGAVQAGTVGQAVTTPPAVTVTDATGNPIAGVPVTFAVTAGGGAIVPADGNVMTDGSGVAALTSWTLGTVAGANALSATSGTLNGSPVAFSATAAADTPDTLRIVAGNGQTDTVAATVPIAPSVIVVDRYGNPVGSVTVTWTVTAGAGSIVPSNGLTTTSGTGAAAVTAWTLGTTPGTNTVEASIAGVVTGNPAPFGATATVGTPSATGSTVSATVPGGLSVSAGDERATVTVTVVDGLGNPIPGAGVTLASSVAGDSMVQPGVTNGSGQTSGTISGTMSGSRTVTATVDGSVVVVQTASVSLLPDPADAVASSVTSSRASIGASSGSDTATIAVTVRDAFGNALSGQGVALVTSVSGTFGNPSGTSDGTGVYATIFHASTPLGDRAISATVNAALELADTVTVTLVAGPVSAGNSEVDRSLGSITASAGGNTSLITVTARDEFNNPVAGASVSLGSNQSNASFTAPANTDGAGGSTSSFSSTNAQLHTITATVGGVGVTDNAQVTVTPAAADAGNSTAQASVGTAIASNTGGSSRYSIITVTVRDAFNNPRSGDQVTFNSNQGGTVQFRESEVGTINNVGTTNASGQVVRYFNADLAASHTITGAVVPTLGSSFNETVGVTITPAEASATFSSVSPDDFSITASNTGNGANLFSIITVYVADAFNNPRSGDNVSFSSNQGGTVQFRLSQGGTLSTSGTTNSSGQIQRWFNATLAATHTITAAIAPTLGSAFNETNSVGVTAAAAAFVTLNSTNNQTARVATAVGTPPSFLVRDAFLNPVPSVSVAFAIGLGGGSRSPTSATTNASGIASLTSWTLGSSEAVVTTNGATFEGHMQNTVTGTTNSVTGTATAWARYEWAANVAPLISTGTSCDGCHDVNPWTRANLINVAATTGTACDGVIRVVPGNATGSLLYSKLTSSPSCGSRMPLSCTTNCFTTTQLKIIQAWIEDGALNN